MKGTTTPVYRNIALDIANKIVRGEIKVNERISGRSTLAGVYNVSPETIRRAVALLEDSGVVAANKGSGIEVRSVAAAEKFIGQYRNNEYISTVRSNMLEILEKRKLLDKELEESIDRVVDFLDRFKKSTPFAMIEVKINDNSPVIDKKLLEVKFWQKTGATLIGYRRDGELVVSPGPDYAFRKGDTIIVIGAYDIYDKVVAFVN
ncbi:MAG: GntR family transcriptional regulator [Clostridia bacterium]|nr:GntR family transcriptional regulator [Clostridia bacterium]